MIEFHTHIKQNIRRSKREDKRFWAKCWQSFSEFKMPLICLCMQFWFAGVILEGLTAVKISEHLLIVFYAVKSFYLCSWDTNVYLAVSAFPYTPAPSLGPNEGARIFFRVFMFRPINKYRQHTTNFICVIQCQSLLLSWQYQSHSSQTITCLLCRGGAATEPIV